MDDLDPFASEYWVPIAVLFVILKSLGEYEYIVDIKDEFVVWFILDPNEDIMVVNPDFKDVSV